LHEFEEVFVPEHLEHDTRNSKVEIISFLSHREGKTMVHICHRKYDGDWDELKDNFCLAFFPISRIGSQPRAIHDFEQHEKEFIGVAWALFSTLIHVSPDLSLPDGIILHLFCSGLDIDADLCLDVTIGGPFTHKPMTEQVEFLENFIDRHTSSVIRTKPL
jgi:hypothetical protein